VTADPPAPSNPPAPATPAAPLARIVLRATFWTSLGTYATQVLGFAVNLVLARILPVETYGYFSMASFWTTQLEVRNKSGLMYAAIQEKALDGELLGTFMGVDVALGGLQFLLGALAAGVLAILGYPPEVVVALLVLMGAESVTALVGPLDMALEKELQVSRLTLLGLVGSVIGYGAAVAIAIVRRDVWALIAINSLVALTMTVGIYGLARQRLPQTLRTPWRFSRALARELLRRGLPTGLSLTTVLGFVSMFDNFLVGTFVGYTALGFYDRAFRTAQWPNLLLTTVISRVGFITFARLRDDPPRLTQAVRLSLWLLLALGLPMGLGLAFAAPDLIGVLYGPAWAQSAAYLPFIAVYALSGLFWGLGFWLSVALKDTRTGVILTVTQAAILLLVATPLTWRFGVAGTLAGVGLTNAVALVLSTAYVFRKVPMPAGETLLPPAIATMVAALALVLLIHAPGWAAVPAVLRLVIVGGVAAGAFGLVLFALRPGEMIERVRYLSSTWRRPH
jgi:lipopolysaccharide exporter